METDSDQRGWGMSQSMEVAGRHQWDVILSSAALSVDWMPKRDEGRTANATMIR